MEKMSFVKACKTFFGFKDGQTLAEFAAELKCLTDQDRAARSDSGWSSVRPTS